MDGPNSALSFFFFSPFSYSSDWISAFPIHSSQDAVLNSDLNLAESSHGPPKKTQKLEMRFLKALKIIHPSCIERSEGFGSLECLEFFGAVLSLLGLFVVTLRIPQEGTETPQPSEPLQRVHPTFKTLSDTEMNSSGAALDDDDDEEEEAVSAAASAGRGQ